MTEKQGLRARLSGLLPGADDIAFNRDRSRTVPASKAPRRGHTAPQFRERESHVLVVPIEGPQFPKWGPGHCNFYFEAFRSAEERLGPSRVSFLDVSPDERPEVWHRQLRDAVHDRQATHIVTHAEHDPGSPHLWTWDVAWNAIAPRWDGVLIGVVFDAAFELVTMKSRRLARMSPNFVHLDICMPADGMLLRDRGEVGPVTMPMSQESLRLIDQRLASVSLQHDISFIGALYPYRVQMIESLRSAGLDVAVNPHRPDSTSDLTSSRASQPGWLDYMAGLAESKMTVNFSRSSAGSWEQLKYRVIEATLAGTFLLTDDRYRTRVYFEPEVEYGYFRDAEDLVKVARQWLNAGDALHTRALAAQSKARTIIERDFWTRIDDGLTRRGLPVTSVLSSEAPKA
jgi:hypothetical protein